MKGNPSAKLIQLFILVFILGSGWSFDAIGQRRINLNQADRLQGGKRDGSSYNSFVGNVIFSHKGILIYCDSAVVFKKEQNLEAYGNVKIDDQDSVIITSKELFYSGKDQLAKLRKDVEFEKRGQMTLYTQKLDYNRMTEVAYYMEGGRLVDSTNVLVSRRGYYQTLINLASFKKDVVGTNPDFTLVSDTLQYNTNTKEIFFLDHTEITNPEGEVFVYESGTYNTKEESSVFYKGYVESPSYYLYGNNLSFNDFEKYYTATENVKVVSKENDIIVLGEEAEYYEKEGLIKVFNDALLKVLSGKDTLYLSADTLVSIDSEIPDEKRLLAYNNVKIFKEDLQGVADSLSYVQIDSVLYFYGDPVLWTEGNQMSADSINIVIKNNTIDRLNLAVNSFVVQQDSIDNFNQIKGRKMEALFRDEKLDKVHVYGNGESIFFMLTEEGTDIVGMNKVVCSDITMAFQDGQLYDITFYTNNEGSFIPPHELLEPDTRLAGFEWYEELRPVFEDVVPLRYLKYYKRPKGLKKGQKPDDKVINVEVNDQQN